MVLIYQLKVETNLHNSQKLRELFLYIKNSETSLKKSKNQRLK